jgi:hypothetical protein
MMSHGTKRRAAAKEAENKIKITLEELSEWSDLKECYFEDSFYDVRSSNNKKPKFDYTKPTDAVSRKNPTNKRGAGDAGAAISKTKAKTDTKASSHMETSESDLATDVGEDAMLTQSELEELDDRRTARERDDRRAARLVHSARPMRLSGRLAWNISRASATSPISPLTVCHLSFAPSSLVILETRRA